MKNRKLAALKAWDTIRNRRMTNKVQCKRCQTIIDVSKVKQGFCKVCQPFGEYNGKIEIMDKLCKIGADPEFLFVNDNNGHISNIDAYTIVSRSTQNRVGTDSCPRTGEIRPKEAENAIKLTKHIKKCLLKVVKKMSESPISKNCKIVVGSGVNNIPIGGHIHFGGLNINTHEIRWNSNNDLIKCLDMISILIITKDNDIQRINRLKRGYGKLGDARRQPWGFEYRTPYSWLKEPKVTLPILALYHSVAMEWQNKGIEKSDALIGLCELYNKIPLIGSKYKQGNKFTKIRKDIIKYVTMLDIIRSDKFGYRETVMEFLNDINKKETSNIIYVDIKKWDLSILNKLFRWNNDEFMNEIKIQIENIDTKNTPIAIIGIKAENKIDIMTDTNQGKIFNVLKSYVDKYDLTIAMADGDYKRFGRMIGFGYNLRKDKLPIIIDILNKIKQIEQEEQIPCAE